MTQNPQLSDAPVLIVGAGVAGLTAATALSRAGISVRLLEASNGVGGRVRSDVHSDGYIIDRGFQVVLDAYPVLERYIDIAALKPNRFERGAVVWDGTRRRQVVNPLSNPGLLLSTVRAPCMTTRDTVILAKIAFRAKTASWKSATDATLATHASGSALQYLQHMHLSQRFIELFAKPFWGGITLDRSLSGNAGSLLYAFKMFLEGAAVLPAEGMQALPLALAANLPPESIQLDRCVDKIEFDDGRATGVWVGGELVPGLAVVVATDPSTARSLTDIEHIPTRGLGCVTVYLAGNRDPGIGKLLLLNAEEEFGVNHLAPLSAVAPSYAPQGKHLVSAVILDHPRHAGMSNDGLSQIARVDVARMLGHLIEDWTPIATVGVPFAQFTQSPGFASTLPVNRTSTVGLYLAGEYTHDSSVNGAMLSGETAAKVVAHDLQVPRT